MEAQVAQSSIGSTAAWLAFAGAVLVAAIAAVTAQWRQRTQLRHDRTLADLAELRAVLDAAAEATFVVTEKLGVALGAAQEWEGADSRAPRDPRPKAAKEARDAAW